MERPTLASVVAIICILFGLFGMCGSPASLSIYFIDTGVPNPVVDIVKSNQIMFIYLVSVGIMGFFLALIEFVGGIGLWMMKPWGRTAIMFFSVCTLLFGVLGMIMNAIFLIPPLMALGDPAAIGGAVGGIVGGCVGMIFPIGFLFVLTRPEVAQAYQPGDSAA